MDTKTRIIGGGVVFTSDDPKNDIVGRLESTLGLHFSPDRQTGDTEYFAAEGLGLRVFLEVAPLDGALQYTLAYRTTDRYYDAPADVVNLDFHFQRILSLEGIESVQLHPD
jgi:hypothetical protein